MGAVLDGYCRRMSPTASGIGYELSRTFSASPDALFDALTSATVLKCMWGVQEIDVDARVGGRAVAVYVADGQDWSFTITYNELARDKGRLSWVARFNSLPSKETRVSVQLVRINEGTALTLSMENFESPEECNANRRAGERGLAMLADLVERA